LANDLRAAFPDMKGMSARSLQYMTAMVRAWGADQNVPQGVAHLPWGHIRTILDKAATADEMDWYAAAAIQYGWSWNVLMNMMMNRSMERTGAFELHPPACCRGIRTRPASGEGSLQL
jgi:predicted nuclease of restriction endonuclease-like (RecB) superfamily